MGMNKAEIHEWLNECGEEIIKIPRWDDCSISKVLDNQLSQPSPYMFYKDEDDQELHPTDQALIDAITDPVMDEFEMLGMRIIDN